MTNPTLNGVFLCHIESFISLKHNLGYKALGTERSLKAFDRFTKLKGVHHISISESLAKEWCTRRIGEANDTWSHRITFLKQFCIYLFNLGFDVYIPQKPPAKRDEAFIPYILSPVINATSKQDKTIPLPLYSFADKLSAKADFWVISVDFRVA